MKKILITLAAVAAAFSFVSCEKETPVASRSELNFNIIVEDVDGNSDTKALKSGWADGDIINIWFEPNIGINPDLTLTRNGSEWVASKVDDAVIAGLEERNGYFKAVWEGTNNLSKTFTASSESETVTRFSVKNTAEAPLPRVMVTRNNYTFDPSTMTVSATVSMVDYTGIQITVPGIESGSWTIKENNVETLDYFDVNSLSSITFHTSAASELYGAVSNGECVFVGGGLSFSARSGAKSYQFKLSDGQDTYTYSTASVALSPVRGSAYAYGFYAVKLPAFDGRYGFDGAKWVKEGGESVVNLSESETSNSYIIEGAGEYKFNATVCGNGQTVEGLDAPSAIAPDAASLVWQTSASMISDIVLKDGSIYFTASETPGNAVIAATKDGEIVWSWHIWNPGVEVNSLASATGYDVMDINLGATDKGNNKVTPACFGLLYQWGRKDPFPGSPVLSGTTSTMPIDVYDAEGNTVSISHSSWYNSTNNHLEYAIANPTVVLTNYAQYSTSRDWLVPAESNDAFWGNPSGNVRDTENNTYPNKGSKTYFDPCPAGWRVPPVDVFRNATPSGGYDETVSNFNVVDVNGDGTIDGNDFNYGWTLYLDKDNEVSTFVPAAARYDGSYGMLYGSVSGMWGNFWSNAPYSAGLGASPLAFQKASMSPNAGGGRADAYSIRCIRDID